MKKLNSFLFISFCLILWSCNTPESMRDFDSDTWKADKNACNGNRTKLISSFEKIRKEMYGKKEYVVRNVLGKPDKENLLERSQRIYFYYIEVGAQCEDASRLSDANRVEVRINSLGKVSEITYSNPEKLTKPE